MFLSYYNLKLLTAIRILLALKVGKNAGELAGKRINWRDRSAEQAPHGSGP